MKAILSAAVAAAAFAFAAPALASTVVDGKCVSVADEAGCLFDGNINPNPDPTNVNGYKNAENAYNAYNNSHPSAAPDITLNFLGDTDDASFGALGGTFTGAGTTSGTWSLPGYLVNFVAVKAGPKFVLYQLATPADSGNWDTFDILVGRGNHPALSHLVFFGTPGGVPEPATWAMMIAGFGLTGAAMRRRKLATAVTA